MLVRLKSNFRKRLKGRIERYSFEVGILQDGPHKLAKNNIGSYAGGPVRKASRQNSGLSISEVSKANRDRLGINYITEPFHRKTTDIIKFTNNFLKLAFGKSEKRRVENLLQAIVRNPILRQEYGSNSEKAKAAKGFNRNMIDTGQLFKAIRATCKIKGGRV